MSSELIWQHTDVPGWEHVRVDSDHPGWNVYDSILVREHSGQVLRGGYTLVTDKQWRTLELRLMIESQPGSMQGVHLLTEGDGRWMDANEQPIPELEGCMDVAIQWTPLTLSLPINRLSMKAGEEQRVRAISVSLPDLTLAPVVERFQRNEGGVVEWQSLGNPEPENFQIDDNGILISGRGFSRSWPVG